MSENNNVFVTPKGKKYHLYSFCNYIKGREVEKIPLIQAKNVAKGLCTVCQRLFEKNGGVIKDDNENKEEENKDLTGDNKNNQNFIFNNKKNSKSNFDIIINNKSKEEKKVLNYSLSNYSESFDEEEKEKNIKDNNSPFIDDNISNIKSNSQIDNTKTDYDIRKEKIINIYNSNINNNENKELLYDGQKNQYNNKNSYNININNSKRLNKKNIDLINNNDENNEINSDENENNNINKNINNIQNNNNINNINNIQNNNNKINNNISNNINKKKEKVYLININSNNYNSKDDIKNLKYNLNPNLPKKDLINWTGKDFNLLEETNRLSKLFFLQNIYSYPDIRNPNIHNIIEKISNKNNNYIEKGNYKFKFEISPFNDIKEPLNISVGFEIDYYDKNEDNNLNNDKKMNLNYDTLILIRNFLIKKKTYKVHVMINILNGKFFIIGNDELEKRNKKIFLNKDNSDIIYLKNFDRILLENIKDVRPVFKYDINYLKIANIDVGGNILNENKDIFC